MKSAPSYAVTSVDHALRLATILQLEGSLTVAAAADRLGVARSTAHRLLQMLVYRDFAIQDEDRQYHAGPVLQLAEHSRSRTAVLRAVGLPHLQRLVDAVGESANLTIRTGADARFIASVESSHALRVTSREGMVFRAHQTTAGLLLLAELTTQEVAATYESVSDEPPNLTALRRELVRIRKQGFAVNQGRSERGVVAVGVPVRSADGIALAGLSISMPSVRYERAQLPALVARLHKTAGAMEADLVT